MRTALDTNVPSRLLGGGADGLLAAALLQQCRESGSLVISPIVYAEMLAHPSGDPDLITEFLQETGIDVEFRMTEAVWREAGRRFGLYSIRRKRSGGGESRRLLADFVVGAHALLQADRLLTFDQKRYAVDFPELVLVPLR